MQSIPVAHAVRDLANSKLRLRVLRVDRPHDLRTLLDTNVIRHIPFSQMRAIKTVESSVHGAKFSGASESNSVVAPAASLRRYHPSEQRTLAGGPVLRQSGGVCDAVIVSWGVAPGWYMSRRWRWWARSRFIPLRVRLGSERQVQKPMRGSFGCASG